MKANKLFKLTNEKYGTWFATTKYYVAKTIGCTAPAIHSLYPKNDRIKGWKIEEVDADILGDLPFKYVNTTNAFIKDFVENGHKGY